MIQWRPKNGAKHGKREETTMKIRIAGTVNDSIVDDIYPGQDLDIN